MNSKVEITILIICVRYSEFLYKLFTNGYFVNSNSYFYKKVIELIFSKLSNDDN